MGLDQYATARKANQLQTTKVTLITRIVWNWPIGVNILTYRDGWKASGMSKAIVVSLIAWIYN